MDKRVDLIVAVAVLAFGAWYYFLADQLPLRDWGEPVGASGLPKALAIASIVFGVWLVASRLRAFLRVKGDTVEPEGESDEPGYPAYFTRVVAVIVLTAIYLALLPALGYVIATPPWMVALLMALGVRDWRQLAGLALGVTVILYLSFVVVLGIKFPTGGFF